jgi:hypothetical protein
MKIVSEFYVKRVGDFSTLGESKHSVEVTLHACGDNVAAPEEALNELGFSASGLMTLRVTNPRLISYLKIGKKFKMSLESIPCYLTESPEMMPVEEKVDERTV